MKISITIPAYNEEKRITRTLQAYQTYFDSKKNSGITYEIIVVLNACTDNTLQIVQNIQHTSETIIILNLPYSGKGRAIIAGFKNALSRENDLIGFVDADMATNPEYFFELIKNIQDYQGCIASRYMQGAVLAEPRPLYKRLGSKFIYEPFVWLLFGLTYKDIQCGAKIFTRHTIATTINSCISEQWALDMELLYLCKKNKFTVKELPTTWTDQTGSTLSIFQAGIDILSSLVKLRIHYSFFKKNKK